MERKTSRWVGPQKGPSATNCADNAVKMHVVLEIRIALPPSIPPATSQSCSWGSCCLSVNPFRPKKKWRGKSRKRGTAASQEEVNLCLVDRCPLIRPGRRRRLCRCRRSSMPRARGCPSGSGLALSPGKGRDWPRPCCRRGRRQEPLVL